MQHRQQPRLWSPFSATEKKTQKIKLVEKKSNVQKQDTSQVSAPLVVLKTKESSIFAKKVELAKPPFNAHIQDVVKPVTPLPISSDTLNPIDKEQSNKMRKETRRGALGVFLAAVGLNILYVALVGDAAILPLIFLIVAVVFVLAVLVKYVAQDLKKSRPSPKPIQNPKQRDQTLNNMRRAIGYSGITAGLLIITGLLLEFAGFWIGYGLAIAGAVLAYVTLILLGIWVLLMIARWY